MSFDAKELARLAKLYPEYVGKIAWDDAVYRAGTTREFLSKKLGVELDQLTEYMLKLSDQSEEDIDRRRNSVRRCVDVSYLKAFESRYTMRAVGIALLHIYSSIVSKSKAEQEAMLEKRNIASRLSGAMIGYTGEGLFSFWSGRLLPDPLTAVSRNTRGDFAGGTIEVKSRCAANIAAGMDATYLRGLDRWPDSQVGVFMCVFSRSSGELVGCTFADYTNKQEFGANNNAKKIIVSETDLWSSEEDLHGLRLMASGVGAGVAFSHREIASRANKMKEDAIAAGACTTEGLSDWDRP